MYQELLKIHGSIRKAASAANLTKSKFMVLYKKELGLCTATTSCKNLCHDNRTRCSEHLSYAAKVQDRNKRKISNKQWRSKNKLRVKNYNSQYQKDNKDRVNELHRKWSKTEKGKIVNRAKRAYRRALLLQATPSWVDRAALKQIYAACPEGYHVDHIIPLDHPSVTGLHVPWNLQYLPASENDAKGNLWDGTYDNKNWKK